MENSGLKIDLALQQPPFVLVARVPAHLETIGLRNTTAVSFTSHDAAKTWVEKAERANRNLYVVRNHVRNGRLYRRDRKAARKPQQTWGNPPLIEDIEAIEWLAIDIDPIDDRHDDARAHGLTLLRRMPVPLHYIMDSGRGVQAAVRLSQRVPSDDTSNLSEVLHFADRVFSWLKQAADAELVQVDNVANLNRFSRLCGTINQKTGRRAAWIEQPDARLTVSDLKGLLTSVDVPRRHLGTCIGALNGLHSFVAEAVRETGLAPTEDQEMMLAQLHLPNPDATLSAEFLHRAESGEDWAGRIHPDRSARMMSFASSAVLSGEHPIAAVRALQDGRYRELNAHWIDPKQGRVNAERAALRAVAKAIMTLPQSGG